MKTPSTEFLKLLLLKAGDVEPNPGPPRRARGAPPALEKKDAPQVEESGPNYLEHKVKILFSQKNPIGRRDLLNNYWILMH